MGNLAERVITGDRVTFSKRGDSGVLRGLDMLSGVVSWKYPSMQILKIRKRASFVFLCWVRKN